MIENIQAEMKAPKPKQVGLGYYYLLSLLYVVTGMILVTVAQFVFVKVNLLPLEMQQYNSVHMFTVISIQATIFLGLRFAFIRLYRFKTFDVVNFDQQPSFFKEFAWFLLAIVGLFITLFIASAFLQALGVKEVRQFEMLDKNLLRENSRMFFITVAIVAPIYEELIFRGFILPSLLREYASRNKTILVRIGAVVFSSALFTILHIQSGVLALIPIGFLAVYFAMVTLLKKSILFSILLHLLQNMVAAHVFLNYEKYQKLLESMPK